MKRKLTPEQKLKVEERRKTVAENLKRGLTYREIADELLLDSRFEGIGVSLGTVHNDVQVIIARHRKETVKTYQEIMALEEARLDAMLKAVWISATKGNLKAVDRVLKIADRRAKLLGLDSIVNAYSKVDLQALSDDELELMVTGKIQPQNLTAIN